MCCACCCLCTNRPRRTRGGLIGTNGFLGNGAFFLCEILCCSTCTTCFQTYGTCSQTLTGVSSAVVLLRRSFGDGCVRRGLAGTSLLTRTKQDTRTVPLCVRALRLGSSVRAAILSGRVRRVGTGCGVSGITLRRRQLGDCVRLNALVIIIVVLVVLITFVLHVSRMHGTLRQSRGRAQRAAHVTRRTGRVGGHFLSGVDCRVHVPLGNMINFSRLVTSRPGVPSRLHGRCSSVVRGGSRRLVHLIGSMLSLSQLRTNVVGFGVRRCELTRLYGRTACVTHVRDRKYAIVQLRGRVSASLGVQMSAIHFARTLLDTLACPRGCGRGQRVSFGIALSARGGFVGFHVAGSPLTSREFASRRMYVHRRVGHLLFRCFKKGCGMRAGPSKGPAVLFAFPSKEG